jgi:hypothetical protein
VLGDVMPQPVSARAGAMSLLVSWVLDQSRYVRGWVIAGQGT